MNENQPSHRIRPEPLLPAHTRPTNSEPWELLICDDLTDKQLELTEKLMEVPRRSSGVIWFNSCGGSVYAGLALASMIRLRGLNATAVVAGECSSAALMPFAACQRRYVTSHATMLFHPIRWTGDEDMRLEDAAEWARHFAALESDLDELLLRLFGRETDSEFRVTIHQWTRPGRFVVGQELADTGVANVVSLTDGDLWSQLRS